MSETGFDALTRFANNLTLNANKGILDPVIGRDEEIRGKYSDTGDDPNTSSHKCCCKE